MSFSVGGDLRLFVLAPEHRMAASCYAVDVFNLAPGAGTSIVIVHLDCRLEICDYDQTRRNVFSAMAGAFAKLGGLDSAHCRQIMQQEEGLPQRAN
jgi:exosome complex RNA-binding protein Rrp42 (RNase PH superfamily)